MRDLPRCTGDIEIGLTYGKSQLGRQIGEELEVVDLLFEVHDELVKTAQ